MSKTQEIVDYLRENPDFFNRHPELMGDMDFSGHPETPSFHQRQLQVLRDREVEQKAKLEIIMDSAKANLQLEQELHELSAQLLIDVHEADHHGNDESKKTLVKLIVEIFTVDEVSVVLEKNVEAHDPGLDYGMLSQRVVHLGSICDDRLASSLVSALFGDSQKKIRSCAFVPLVVKEKLKGVMIIGSINENRFKPGFGVMFLDRLGLIASAYLQPALFD
ncbi:MAG: DUF484 family protein [Gammaproteobacteria bacterium]|nr:DUF484 family protein [Gammaproteobacteria bacterium]